MNNIVRRVKGLGGNLQVTADKLRGYRLNKDDQNPDDRFNLKLRKPEVTQQVTSSSSPSHKMILEITGDKPIRNIREPELKDGIIRTYLSLEDGMEGDDEIAMSQFYELELEDNPSEGNWQIELNTTSKEKEETDPERDHRYVFLKA